MHCLALKILFCELYLNIIGLSALAQKGVNLTESHRTVKPKQSASNQMIYEQAVPCV